jgi:hypothetical protein
MTNELRFKYERHEWLDTKSTLLKSATFPVLIPLKRIIPLKLAKKRKWAKLRKKSKMAQVM